MSGGWHEQRARSRVRRRAERLGYRVLKSRERKYVPHSNSHGLYMLVRDNSRFDVTLEEIASYLDQVPS